ncbi:MAG TPA: DnaJ domain-containing protein [Bacteroidia bacterium]|nr:DnaJ domain-containing protein [Bacteroidia bacterium]
MKDHYRTLGIAENATARDIKLAYRRLAKKYHPDVNTGDLRAEERFKEIVEAYDVLSDPFLKNAYDLKRNRQDYFPPHPSFYSYEKKQEPVKNDPRRKTYDPSDLQRVREKNRKRILEQMRRRRKLLAGMVITFILYLFGTAAFETWIEAQRKKSTDSISFLFAEEMARRRLEESAVIRNFDSPYDSVFGGERYQHMSPNQFIVVNPVSDAVVCLVQHDAPNQTIRNVFIRAKKRFNMNDVPNGTYYFKVYTGATWDKKKAMPKASGTGGAVLGGFTRDEEFFRLMGTFTVQKPTPENLETNTRDTIVIDPTIMEFERITIGEFFDKGDE